VSAPVLCVFGTASGVGKSLVATALCRIFHDQGARVAPYKAQNLSNNAGVSAEGLEMGRAQIVQAAACGVAPRVAMNPLLVKPMLHRPAQVIAMGRALPPEQASAYFRGEMAAFRDITTGALDQLRANYDLIVAEGAGSCAEVNLRARDLVNFPIARHAGAAVILVADMSRGGVFAQVVGTLACLEREDRKLVRGIVLNQFHGPPQAFADGVAWLEEATGVPVLGVLPHLDGLRLEEEDGAPRHLPLDPPLSTRGFNVACIAWPHLSNADDLLHLEAQGAAVHLLTSPRNLSSYDMVVLPGSKATLHDLKWFRDTGWTERLDDYITHGGAAIGICGGMQALGRTLSDPHGVEGPPQDVRGLGHLPIHTVMAEHKTTRVVAGTLEGVAFRGYEIHVGETTNDASALLELPDRSEGARSGRVFGTYVHGLFQAPGILQALLQDPALTHRLQPTAGPSGIDQLAQHFEKYVKMDKIRAMIGAHPTEEPSCDS